MKRPLFVLASSFLLASTAPAVLTLQFANRWNLQENLYGAYMRAIPTSGGAFIAVGQAGPDIVLAKYDGSGNLITRRRYDRPGGGREGIHDAISDTLNGVIIAYGTENDAIRYARFNTNLAPLADGEVYGAGFGYRAMTTDGTRVIFGVDSGTDSHITDRLFAGGNSFTATIDAGPNDFIAKMAIRNGELIIAGGTGSSPIILWRNANTGAQIRSAIPNVPGWSNGDGFRFNDMTVDANDGDILAVGQGIQAGNNRGFLYSVEFDGTGALQNEYPDAWVSVRAAKAEPNATVAYLYETNAAEFRIRSVSTNTAALVDTSAAFARDGSASALFVTPDASRIMASRRLDASNLIGQSFAGNLVNSSSISSSQDPGLNDILSMTTGAFPNTAFGVGRGSDLTLNFGITGKVALMGASQIWDFNEIFTGFPSRQAFNSSEDAAGARYIPTVAGEVLNKYAATTLLKVNSAGTAVWARPITWDPDPALGTIVFDSAMAPDGTVIIAGYSGSPFSTDTTGHVSKINATTGNAIWTRSMRFNGAGLSFTKVRAAADGSIYAAGTSYLSSSGDIFVTKLTSAGEIAWTRNMDLAGGASESLSGLELSPNGVAVAFTGSQTARVRVLTSSTGAIHWDRQIVDPQGALPGTLRMTTGPANTLTLAAYFTDGAARRLIGVMRVNPVTRATLLNTRFGAPDPDFQVTTLSTGDPIVVDANNLRLTRLHPTNGTITWGVNLLPTIRNSRGLTVDRLNNIYALLEEEQVPGTFNSLLAKFSPAGAGIENRRASGNPGHVSIGLNDSVWVIGGVNTLNRGEEVSLIRYTQTLP